MKRRRLLLALAAICLAALPTRAEFVRGIYTYGAETFDTIAAMGCNLVVCGPTWDTEMRRARALGFKVIPSWWGDEPAHDAMFRQYDADSLFVAWYPFDEPDIYGFSPAAVEAKITRLRQHSPTKPVFLTVWGPAHYPRFLPYAGIFGITPYPIGADPGQVHLDIVGRYTRYARELCGAKPLLVCIPAFYQRPWQYRAPTAGEMHNFVYQALTGSPDGIIFFIWQVKGLDGVIWRLDEHPDLMREITAVNRELIALDKVLTRGRPAEAIEVQPASVFHRVIALNDDRYWILANPGEQPVTARLELPEPAGSVKLLHGGRATLARSPNRRAVAVRLGRLGYAAIRIRKR